MELQLIQNKIFEIRGQKVMLDFDLADIYKVETKNLKRQVKRNIARFPFDFMFELTENEWENLRCQFGTSSWGGLRYMPYAFTEQGIAQLSSVLNSPFAIEMNIEIIRAFVALRKYALGYAELLREIIAEVKNSKFSNRKGRKGFSQGAQCLETKEFILCVLCVFFATFAVKNTFKTNSFENNN
jgi:hypothetical protein